MKVLGRALAIGCLGMALAASAAHAQVQTGAITGTVTDTSGALLPGVAVSLSGEKLIGGTQTQVSDERGVYRFDRLPPGTYKLRFELQGFRTVDREDIRISAAFVATVNARLEIGTVNESITVTGESPTIDTRSNLQQTVMSQEVLEGVPTGRDPWSLAKIIPGVQISTYDVGGTQSYQQSSLSSHGSSTNDVSYNIDGATVNWPGGGGGATMLYYDQGMFEEVNYMTSAIPAEVLAGGVSINMVTKDAGNKWRGNTKYYFANQDLQADNTHAEGLPAGFLGNPTKTLYDFNLSGGGAILVDRLWVTGAMRRWVVDKYVNARNPDGTQALDDNTLKNYSGKAVFSASQNHKVSFSYNHNNKIRGHRRDTPPDLVPDIASLVQTNPASSTQARYTGIFGQLVYESSFSVMDGQTNYLYQPGTPANAIRAEDATLNTASFAAQRHEENPNSRTQVDNIATLSKTGWGGTHLFKGGVQFARLYFEDRYDVQGSMYLLYTNGVGTGVRLYNTPTQHKNIEHVLGFFVQDSWTVGRKMTLNLGGRFDHNTGILPDQSAPAGPFIGERTLAESTPIKQSMGVWRAGLVYDPWARGQTAIKTSYSRYGLQVGIDRVSSINPLAATNQTCPWTDSNLDGIAQSAEIQFSRCGGFPGVATRYADADGPRWPFSDEVTVGAEHEIMRNMRLGVMYYYRTNRDQLGTRNLAIPPEAYTPITVNVPNGPKGATTATVFNLGPTYSGRQNNIVDNQDYLDTTYKGIEFTASKRLSQGWQMTAGLTIGKNRGGLNAGGTTSGQSATSAGDLNDPNLTAYREGTVGNDSEVAFRLSGSYQAPWDIHVAGSLISNGGYPYVSTFSVTRTLVPTLTRATQTIFLSERGEERYPSVTMLDLRFSRPFRFARNFVFVPQVDLFNIFNAATVVTLTPAVGGSYLRPTQILAPRIMRIGFSLDF